MFGVFIGRGIFEFGADNEEADADGEPFRGVIGGRCYGAEKQRAVGKCGTRERHQQQADERQKPSESHDFE
jgi:hypothetical protein